AATVIWDADGVAGGAAGGSGTWDTVGLLWNNAGVMATWNNATNHTAVFGDTAGTVTLGAPITAGGLNFGITGYTIASNTLSLANNANVTLNTAANSTTTIA